MVDLRGVGRLKYLERASHSMLAMGQHLPDASTRNSLVVVPVRCSMRLVVHNFKSRLRGLVRQNRGDLPPADDNTPADLLLYSIKHLQERLLGDRHSRWRILGFGYTLGDALADLKVCIRPGFVVLRRD
jgi:hypothetical protein